MARHCWLDTVLEKSTLGGEPERGVAGGAELRFWVVSCNYYAIYSACLDQPFIPAAIQAIGWRIRLTAAALLEPHGWNEHIRSVRDGFVGGRCGGAAPAQGRPLAADRPYYDSEGRRNSFALLVRGCESVAAWQLRTIEETRQDGLECTSPNPLANGANEKATAIMMGQMQVHMQSNSGSTQEDDR